MRAPPTPLLRRVRAAALVACGLVSLAFACSTTPTPGTKGDTLCVPGNYVFCRCQDRQDGTKLCKEDGQSFGPCEPCPTNDNPRTDPRPDPDPFPELDASDASKEEPDPDPPECRNGVVEQGEDCDDQNDTETDGCDSKCKLAGSTPPATNACPGLTVHVWGGAHAPAIVVKTSGSGNRQTTPNCTTGDNPTSGAAAPDRVFKVVAHKKGVMKVTTTEANYNSFLYVSDACAPGKNNEVTFLACVNANGGAGGETLSFPVDADKTYYVFVDGAGISGQEGTSRVTFSIP